MSDQAAVARTTLDRRWLVRMIPVFLLVAGFSLYGLFDATIAYPKRGERVARAALRELLKISSAEMKMSQVSSQEPAAELDSLQAKDGQGPGSLSAVERAKLNWLTALDRIGRLTPEHTVIVSPPEKVAELEQLYQQDSSEFVGDPLTRWDLPMQWVIFYGCAVGAIWILVVIIRERAKAYTWDAATQTLGLPGGHSVTPADLKEVDKRKWHKYIVVLEIKEGHATLGGKGVKLDLFVHTPLEEWILAMEKTAFPEAAAAADTPAAPTAPSSPGEGGAA